MFIPIISKALAAG